MNLINENEILQKWAPILENEVGLTDKNKINWLAKYCHNHELFENNNLATVHSINGMGATRFPGDPLTLQGFSTQATGSGDKANTLLPLAMQVGAHCVGLDLVPVVPMAGPMGILTYMDFVYAGGKIRTGSEEGGVGNATGKDIPLVVIADGIVGATNGAGDAVVFGAEGETENGVKFVYIANSRLDGRAIFAVVGELTTGTLLTAFNLSSDHGGTGDYFGFGEAITKLELVKAYEDHITGFSGNALRAGNYTNVAGASGHSINDPYSRDLGERTEDNVMNLQLFNKSVEAKTFQIAAGVTREQVQDLKQFNIDAVAQVESALISELTQSLNKIILQRLFDLGEQNHKQIIQTQKANFFLNIGATATTIANTYTNDQTAFGSYLSDQIFFNTVSMPASEVINSASENLHTRQRKIMSKMLAISNIIGIRGRRGNATWCVTNGQVCSALQDCAGFIAAPMANTMNQMAGNLYPVGTLAGLAVYNDQNMPWNDTRFCVGRKGDGNSPGLVFMPYIMAESVQTIAEGTMAPKIAVKSRFALVEAGFHPQTMYLTSGVFMNSALGSLV